MLKRIQIFSIKCVVVGMLSIPCCVLVLDHLRVVRCPHEDLDHHTRSELVILWVATPAQAERIDLLDGEASFYDHQEALAHARRVH